MDFTENVKASEAADFAYAQWYAGLPDERKAQFFLSGFKLVAEKIRQDVKKENPFSTEAEMVWRFIELTQKEAYSEETFAFIRQKMQERVEEEWKQRFRAMKKQLNWTYAEIAEFMGAGSADAVKASISRKLPAFAKLAVCVFEQMQQQQGETGGEG